MRQELHQHFPSCQNMETGLEGSICKEQSIHSREVLLVDVPPMCLDTTQVC